MLSSNGVFLSEKMRSDFSGGGFFYVCFVLFKKMANSGNLQKRNCVNYIFWGVSVNQDLIRICMHVVSIMLI